MITSVLIGVGRALIKGEKLDSEKLVGRSMLSGVIAGVIGGFLGGHIHTGTGASTTITAPPDTHGG